MNSPNPNIIYPIKGNENVIYIKPTIKNPNIIVGEFTYFSDNDFEKHITHHYEWYNDKVIVGKFCQIAAGVNFIMNGANHQMDCVSTFPFYIFDGFNQKIPDVSQFRFKGDTVIANDVWIGENVTILPGVNIGDGAIIAANSVVGSDIPPYTIYGGNPAECIRKRFDDELIGILEKLQWWNLPIDTISSIIPVLSNNNLEQVKEKLLEIL